MQVVLRLIRILVMVAYFFISLWHLNWMPALACAVGVMMTHTYYGELLLLVSAYFTVHPRTALLIVIHTLISLVIQRGLSPKAINWSARKVPKAVVKNGIQFEMVTEKNMVEVVKCWSENSMKSEPAQRWMFLPDGPTRREQRDYETFFTLYVKEIVAMKLSWCARDVKTNKVICYRLASDMNFQHNDLVSALLSMVFVGYGDGNPLAQLVVMLIEWGLNSSVVRKGSPILYIMNVGLGAWAEKQESLENILEMSGVGVDDAYIGRGIAGRATQLCLDNAKALGYTRSVVWCTNSISHHVFKDKLGWTYDMSFPYENVVHQGKRVYAGLTDRFGNPQPISTVLSTDL